jgi:hypothetical protein
MKNLLFLSILAIRVACAQWASYPSLNQVLDSKLTFTTGSGAPTSSCTPGKDVYTDLTGGGSVYWCGPSGWARLSSITISGSPASGNLAKFSGASSITNGDLSGDVTTSGTLAATVGKVNGVAYGASPSTNTVPVVTGTNTVTYEPVPNGALANSSVTVPPGPGLSGGGSVALGGTATALSVIQAINAQTGTSYPFVSGDQTKLVTFSNSAAVAASLSQATGSFGATWWVDVKNKGAGTVTITPTTSTIDGASTLVLTTGQGAHIVSDGTNYQTGGSIGGGGTLAASTGINIATGGGKSTIAVDTAVIPTHVAIQSGSDKLCPSSSGSGSTYTCSMTPTLTAYAVGMVINWIPDVNGTGGATTFNADRLGGKPIKESNGTADPTSSDIVAGQLYGIWYDGTSFRLPPPGAIPPTLDTTFALVDNFCAWTTGAGASLGTGSTGLQSILPWQIQSFGSTIAWGSLSTGCGLSIATDSTANDFVQFTQGVGASSRSQPMPYIIPTVGNYDLTMVLSVWTLSACRGGTCSSASTGVTPVANKLYTLRLFSTKNGTVQASVNGSSPVSVSTNLISTISGVGFGLYPTASVAATAKIYRFKSIVQLGQ